MQKSIQRIKGGTIALPEDKGNLYCRMALDYPDIQCQRAFEIISQTDSNICNCHSISAQRKNPLRTGKPYVDIERLPAIVRLPIRTLTCMHGREAVCPHCVEGVQMRVQYGAALAQKPAPRILRLDAWRASTDSQQRRAAGMEDLHTTMALLQHQMMLHAKYRCDGCVHCKEEELLHVK